MGDALTSHGVTIYSAYGRYVSEELFQIMCINYLLNAFSSELGPIAKAYCGMLFSVPRYLVPSWRLSAVRPGKDWEYFEINPQHEAVLVDQGDDKSELVVIVSVLLRSKH